MTKLGKQFNYLLNYVVIYVVLKLNTNTKNRLYILILGGLRISYFLLGQSILLRFFEENSVVQVEL